MAIPANRPVIGRDLDDVRQLHGLSVADACWAYGISLTKWSQIVRGVQPNPKKGIAGTTPDDPVTDPTLALLVRLLDANTDVRLVPEMPTVAEMSALVADVTGNATQKFFAVGLGNEMTSAYRWSRIGQRPPATVDRLMYSLKQALAKREPADKTEFLAGWRKIVRAEATARGADGDVFETGRWPQLESKVKRRQSAKRSAPTSAKTAKAPTAKRSKVSA